MFCPAKSSTWPTTTHKQQPEHHCRLYPRPLLRLSPQLTPAPLRTRVIEFYQALIPVRKFNRWRSRWTAWRLTACRVLIINPKPTLYHPTTTHPNHNHPKWQDYSSIFSLNPTPQAHCHQSPHKIRVRLAQSVEPHLIRWRNSCWALKLTPDLNEWFSNTNSNSSSSSSKWSNNRDWRKWWWLVNPWIVTRIGTWP